MQVRVAVQEAVWAVMQPRCFSAKAEGWVIAHGHAICLAACTWLPGSLIPVTACCVGAMATKQAVQMVKLRS